jgi:hypothetical protein
LHLARGAACILAEILSPQFPIHAPTAAAGSIFSKKQLKVTPEFLRERMKRQVKFFDQVWFFNQA